MLPSIRKEYRDKLMASLPSGYCQIGGCPRRRRSALDHDHYTEDYLAGILMDAHSVAIYGASTDEKRPSYWVAGFLLGKGYQVVPVNPAHAGHSILGRPFAASLAALDTPVDIIDIFRRPAALGPIVDEILALPWRPRAVWMQLGIRDDQAAQRLEAAGMKVVMNRALVTEYPLAYERLHRPH
jgi:uncharacterized protein